MGDLAFVLGRLGMASPAHFTIEDFRGEHGLALRTLQELGVIGDQSYPLPAVSCTACEDDVPYETRADGRVFKSCACGYEQIDPQVTQMWRLDISSFLSKICEAMNAEADVSSICSDILLRAGTYREHAEQRTLLFVRRYRGHEATISGQLDEFRAPSILHGFDVPERIGRGCVIDLRDVLDIGDGALRCDLARVKALMGISVVAPGKDCIPLDSTIFLKLPEAGAKGGIYLTGDGPGSWSFHPIPPLGSKIIRYLHDLRHTPEWSKGLSEIAAAFGSSPSSTSNRIKEIRKLCSSLGCKAILRESPANKWSINREFDCCRRLH